MNPPVLHVRGLRTAIRGPGGVREILRGIDFDLAAGETLGLVGESGCGKTLLCTSILAGVRPFPGVIAGSVLLRIGGDGNDLCAGLAECIPPALSADPGRIPDRRAAAFKARHARNVAPFRGRGVAYLHQNSPQALDPLQRVGRAVAHSVRRAEPGLDSGQVRRRVLDLFESLCLREPERILDLYPHELSLGMAKRVALAQALALDPAILFVDEPTTGLDLVLQGEVVSLFCDLRDRRRTSIVFVSHEIDLLSHVADRIVVLRDGEVADCGPWSRYFGPNPTATGYAAALLGAR